jgi:hypothetical protein
MMAGNTTDTQDKIIMKDHDILIAVHTLQTEMMRRWDEYAKTNDARHEQTSRELGEISRTQIKVDGDITSVKGMFNTLDERVDKLESKNLWMTIASYIGIIIAGVIAWFKS